MLFSAVATEGSSGEMSSHDNSLKAWSSRQASFRINSASICLRSVNF